MPETNTIDTGGDVGVHVLEAACPVLLDEQTHRRKDGGIFSGSGPAPGLKPVVKAALDVGQDLHIRGQQPGPLGGQATGKDKSEALCHPSHLFRGVRRANTVHDQGDAGLYILAGFLTMGAQPLQEGPPGMSVVFGAKHLEAVGNGPGVRQAVKIRQHGLVHGQAHKAHFLAASGLQTVLRKLVRKPQLTG